MRRQTKFLRWRTASGLSQTAVAELLGLGRASVYAYETAEHCPDPYIARRIRRMTTILGPTVVTAADLQADWERVHQKADDTAFETRLKRLKGKQRGKEDQQKVAGKAKGQGERLGV